ncbi:MAG: hypothetical protein GY828_08730 [Candidatus Gracilibacteria bacterium]|nr:hypothetical protein [Candidatus Gracilibacteria bacterium]
MTKINSIIAGAVLLGSSSVAATEENITEVNKEGAKIAENISHICDSHIDPIEKEKCMRLDEIIKNVRVIVSEFYAKKSQLLEGADKK